MRLGNKLGIAAVFSLVLSAALGFQDSMFELHPHFGVVLIATSTALCLISLGLFVIAGIKGSRWWLVAPVALICGWLFILSRGV
ncbi:MAG TPA: hypothetical protein VII58_01410 [Acidobacteriaceae bacterium]